MLVIPIQIYLVSLILLSCKVFHFQFQHSFISFWNGIWSIISFMIFPSSVMFIEGKYSSSCILVMESSQAMVWSLKFNTIPKSWSTSLPYYSSGRTCTTLVMILFSGRLGSWNETSALFLVAKLPAIVFQYTISILVGLWYTFFIYYWPGYTTV